MRLFIPHHHSPKVLLSFLTFVFISTTQHILCESHISEVEISSELREKFTLPLLTISKRYGKLLYNENNFQTTEPPLKKNETASLEQKEEKLEASENPVELEKQEESEKLNETEKLTEPKKSNDSEKSNESEKANVPEIPITLEIPKAPDIPDEPGKRDGLEEGQERSDEGFDRHYQEKDDEEYDEPGEEGQENHLRGIEELPDRFFHTNEIESWDVADMTDVGDMADMENEDIQGAETIPHEIKTLSARWGTKTKKVLNKKFDLFTGVPLYIASKFHEAFGDLLGLKYSWKEKIKKKKKKKLKKMKKYLETKHHDHDEEEDEHHEHKHHEHKHHEHKHHHDHEHSDNEHHGNEHYEHYEPEREHEPEQQDEPEEDDLEAAQTDDTEEEEK